MSSTAIKHLSAKVTLHGEIQVRIKAGDILVVVAPCTDLADRLLYTNVTQKVLNQSDLVEVKDYFIIQDSGFKAVRAYYDKKLYYIDSLNLTTLPLYDTEG